MSDAVSGHDTSGRRVFLEVWQIPEIDTERLLLTGTAAGLAREIGIDAVYVRTAFVVLALTGWGLPLYLGAWFVIARFDSGRRSYVPIAKATSPGYRLLGFAMIATGLISLAAAVGLSFSHSLVWPAALVGSAIAIGLDQGTFGRFRPLGEAQSHNVVGRVLIGLGLLFAGVIVALVLSVSLWQAIGGVAVAGLVLLGAAVVFAPVLRAAGTDLLTERRRRIRSEERAEMAAHLHDSVLQTLALIQKRSDDAGVVSLARRQERELHGWLFDDRALHPNLGFRAGLEQQLAAVEDLYEIPIEVIVVGDCEADENVMAVLQASREAAANAARHSGAQRIDVFAEVGATGIEVFVRDLGVGFDLASVDSDRAGIRDSIIARVERRGGTATITSEPGVGTEVELRMPLARPALTSTLNGAPRKDSA